LREFQPWDGGSGLEAVFPEIAGLAEQCRFRDCRHEGEPGCAVQQALGDGSLEMRRFEHYLRLRREQAFQKLRRGASASRVEKERWKGISQLQKQLRRREEA
jgi:ribosome biogenesis GTPase / thiamine phosphate phosphatase